MLRLVKVFTKLDTRIPYYYARFKGKNYLSTNLDAWKNYCGYISYNMDYSKSNYGEMTENAYKALVYLSKHNKFYVKLEVDRELFNFISNNKNFVVNKKGQPYLKVISEGPNKNAGKDDYLFKRLPIAQKVDFKEVGSSENIQSKLKTIVSDTKGNEFIEPLLLFMLYPTGEYGISNDDKKYRNKVIERLLHDDNSFRQSIEWIFYHFDVIEKKRLMFQQLRYLKNNLKGITKKK